MSLAASQPVMAVSTPAACSSVECYSIQSQLLSIVSLPFEKKIITKPIILTSITTPTCIAAPSITLPPSSLTLYEGQSLQLSCAAAGWPTPLITVREKNVSRCSYSHGSCTRASLTCTVDEGWIFAWHRRSFWLVHLLKTVGNNYRWWDLHLHCCEQVRICDCCCICRCIG